MPARPWGSRGHRPRDPQGLAGIIYFPIMHRRTFFILFHHLYHKTKLIFVNYFSGTAVARTVGYCGYRLHLKCHFRFINKCVNVNTYSRLNYLFSLIK